MKDNDFTHFLETLKQKCDIVSTVSRYVPLSKKGRNYWGCCPFHREKTPSFSVNPDGFYKCFGCGEAGDVIKFVQNYENLDFIEAVSSLAKTAGLEVPAFKKDDAGGTADTKQKKDIYAAICKDTAKFYYSVLAGKSEQAAKTLDYLVRRGLDATAVKKFGLGLSPDFQSLPDYLRGKGYSAADCITAGVLSKNEKGNVYDALYERLIFPIINVYGTVAGFGGRILKKSDFAKYKNTTQTPLFDKSKNLYGINNVKKAKQEKRGEVDSIIIVEGYMDAVSLIQAGYAFTVASMGTSLTVEQARLIKRFTDTAVICYDGDSAGQAATLRGLEILKAEGLTVRVASLPDNLDPDDMIRKRGRDAYQKCLDDALPLTDYRLKRIKEKYNLEGKADEAKRNYLGEALPVIRELAGPERESYIKLLSRETGFAPDFLKKEADKKPPIKSDETNENNVIMSTDPQAAKEARAAAAIKCVLAAMVFNKRYADGFELSPYITKAAHADVYDYIKKCRQAGKPPVPAMLFDVTESADADEILNFNFGAEEEKLYRDAVDALKGEDDKNRLGQLMQQYNGETDLERKKEIAKEIQKEQKRRRNI